MKLVHGDSILNKDISDFSKEISTLQIIYLKPINALRKFLVAIRIH